MDTVNPKTPASQQIDQIVGDDLGSFTMLPDFILHLGLSPDALALYCHYKSIIHENTRRACWKSTKTLCTEVGISDDRLRRAKQELKEHSLIEVSARTKPNGGRETD